MEWVPKFKRVYVTSVTPVWRLLASTRHVRSIVVRVGRCQCHSPSFARNRLACPTVSDIVREHCNLHPVNTVEEIGHQDNEIDWSYDNNPD